VAPDTGNIKRRFRRKTERIPITLLMKNQGLEFQRTASTVDFSEQGLRVRTTAELSEGQIVYVLASRGFAPLGYCRVVWVRETDHIRRNEAGLKLMN
jgi:PilZ domain